MKRWGIAGWVLAALVAVTANQVMAQQDEGPVLKPKPKPAATGILLVMCDLACNWKLDGEAKGRIEAGGSAKAKVEFGQHDVIGATEDALVRDRLRGMSLTNVARKYSVSRASIVRFVRDAQRRESGVLTPFQPETQQVVECAA